MTDTSAVATPTTVASAVAPDHASITADVLAALKTIKDDAEDRVNSDLDILDHIEAFAKSEFVSAKNTLEHAIPYVAVAAVSAAVTAAAFLVF